MSQGREETGYEDVRQENERVLCEVIEMDGRGLPSWLGGGTFYRQCGGAFLTSERDGASGLIDGLAHIASFAFDRHDRKVRFSNKFMKAIFMEYTAMLIPAVEPAWFMLFLWSTQ